MTRAGLLAAATLSLTVVLTACAGGSSPAACVPTSPPPGCADLLFRGRSYDEYRPIQAPPPEQMQELGDANYPACNDDRCTKGDLGGFGATDVWLLTGVDPRDAVVGIREASSTYVVFVRRGVDPRTLAVAERVPGS